ncbi:MAG TPA: hypothetical protein VFI59_15355 [Actinomycetota bacterium]|nr:hypothetical protein [Actinomycetota bacterium]
MALILDFDGALGRAAIVSQCDRVRALLDGADSEQVVCDVGALVHPDGVAIETLARMQLTASRLGRRIVLLEASAELMALLSLTGLRGAIPSAVGSSVEPVGQSEEREEVRRVEEEADAGDAIA